MHNGMPFPSIRIHSYQGDYRESNPDRELHKLQC